MQGNLLNNILNALEQAIKKNDYHALDNIIKNTDELEKGFEYSDYVEAFDQYFRGYQEPIRETNKITNVSLIYFLNRIMIKEIITNIISGLGNSKTIEHYSNFLFKDENLSIVPMFFASKEYIEVMLKNQDALNKLKKLKIELKGLNIEINFFTAVACAVKEKELLDKLLTSGDVEQIYKENLQDKNNDLLYELPQAATLSGNIEFIDIFLNESENAALGIKKIQPGFDLQDLGIDSVHKRGPKSNLSSDTSDTEDDSTEVDSVFSSRPSNPISKDTEDESAGEEESVISFNSRPSIPISSDIPDVDCTIKRIGSQESLDSGFDSGTSTPMTILNSDDQELHIQGLKKSLLKILEVGISQEKGEVIQYLYRRFNETEASKIKEVFITAVQDQEVKKALKKQETTRFGSIQVHDLMNKWFLDIELEPRFQAIKDSVCKLDEIDFRKNPEDLKEKMEITYDLLDKLKRGIIEVLQTAIDEKKYSLIKHLSDNIKVQSIDIQEIFDKALKNKNIHQSVNSSKEVKRILYGNQKSVLDVITELIIKIKNMINEIINYFYPSKDIEEQLSTPTIRNNASDSVQKDCDDRTVINQSISPNSNIDSVSTTSNSKCYV